MSRMFKKSALMAAILGGVMFQLGGCFTGQWRWVWAILQEDIFG